MNIILSIAGSDPSGGAGIQADLKTITTLGCYGAAAITAITCQNSQGVSHCLPLSPQLVVDQVSAVLSDMAPSHIKIGMTASAEIISALAKCLDDFTGEIIFDPVLKASAGQSLLGSDSPEAMVPLLQRVTVLTPNIMELAILSGQEINNEEEAKRAAETLLDKYPNIKALCIKGGHLCEEKKEVIDILLVKAGSHGNLQISEVRHPRRQTQNSHGTGCTFASAFAALHAQLMDYQKAFESAVLYVDSLLEMSKDEKIGVGIGPLQHFRMSNFKS
ncbi:MAG: bifunctional hydroxymethylpyrimidine kinase/phosphomethylpyrimidine kinase [Thermodesulfobacteriota bacterium]